MKKSRWDKIIDVFAGFSEAANIGIVSTMVSRWWPAIMLIGGGFFATLAFITDPVIYFFKSLIRLTRIVGRNAFGITFDEEKNGVHKWQTAADIASLVLFSMAIVMFLGLILSGPIGTTIGWAVALTGLSIVGYFDYVHQAKLAKVHYVNKHREFVAAADTYEEICKKPDATLEDKEYAYNQVILCRQAKDTAYNEYKTKQYSKRLFMGLLVGLAFLLICGSAAVFAPPALAPILFIASKVASGYLGLIAAGRFLNWATSGKEKKPTTVELKDIPLPQSQQKISQSLQVQLQSNAAMQPKSKDDQRTDGLTATEVNRAIEKYDNYKKSKLFNRTSEESLETIAKFRSYNSDLSKTDQDRALLAHSYFAERKNVGKAFYDILSETINERSKHNNKFI